MKRSANITLEVSAGKRGDKVNLNLLWGGSD